MVSERLGACRSVTTVTCRRLLWKRSVPRDGTVLDLRSHSSLHSQSFFVLSCRPKQRKKLQRQHKKRHQSGRQRQLVCSRPVKADLKLFRAAHAHNLSSSTHLCQLPSCKSPAGRPANIRPALSGPNTSQAPQGKSAMCTSSWQCIASLMSYTASCQCPRPLQEHHKGYVCVSCFNRAAITCASRSRQSLDNLFSRVIGTKHFHGIRCTLFKNLGHPCCAGSSRCTEIS